MNGNETCTVNQGFYLTTYFLFELQMGEADEAGTPEERLAFMRELENFYKENALEFKAPKFYGEPLNCLK